MAPSLCVILGLLVLCAKHSKQLKNPADEPIKYKMQYNRGWRLGANWSTTTRESDWSMHYPVVKYSDYAPNIESFINKYPYFTVQTYGRAISESTFGDVGSGHFGALTFETINFNSPDYRDIYFVNAWKNHFTFDVGAGIGIGVKFDGEYLYLRPFINGWIYSVGARWRYLDFGLEVTSVTFQPKSAEFIP